MSKKSRKRNKKILGALAAGLGAMALAKRGQGTASSNPVGGLDAIVRRNRAIDAGIGAAEADKGSEMYAPKRKKIWTGDQTMAPNRSIWRAKGGSAYKHGGSVTGVAKRGFGRALMKGKK